MNVSRILFVFCRYANRTPASNTGQLAKTSQINEFRYIFKRFGDDFKLNIDFYQKCPFTAQ